MFLCYLCEKERVYTNYFCEDCRKIKNIMNVYGKEDVLSILQTACLRDQTQIGYKLDKMIKNSQPNTSKKSIVKTKEESRPNVIDEAHGLLEPVKTRSQVKKNPK